MARVHFRGSFLVVAVVALLWQTTQAVTVTVTPGTTFQTMDGIGAFGAGAIPILYRPAGSFWMNRPQTYDIDRFVTDFGASMVRFDIPSTCSPAEGQPNSWVPAAPHIKLMRELISRGVNRFILTAWSPPGWMKYNKSAIQGGTLDRTKAGLYAVYLAEFCKMIKDSTGVEPYALSVQNEPMFVEPYESATMSDEEMDHQLTITQPELTARGLTTRFFGPEHMIWSGIYPFPITARNPSLYAFAGHGYTEGVTPDYGNDTRWASLRDTIRSSKKIWMTESSPLPATALLTAESIHMSLVSGQLSAWVWWWYAGCGTYTQTNGVNTAWVPNGGYYGTKHYARFVRTGAVRISSASSDPTLWATAFKNTDNTYAVVLINTGSGAVTTDISGTGLPTAWNQYTTSGSSNCALTGTTNGTGISMAAGAVVTLLSGSPVPVLGPDTTQNSLTAPAPDNTIGLLNAFGDDVLGVWVNGVKIRNNADSGTASNQLNRQVALNSGENIIACYVKNVAWGGGLLASMLLPPKAGSSDPDTLRTDGSWKVTYRNPTSDAAWNSLAFDDSKWSSARDAGQADVWPGFARWGTMAVNMFYQKARWVLGGEKTYFRKNITFSNAYTGVFVRGSNFTYKMYVDGVMVRQGSEFASCLPITDCRGVPAVTYNTSIASGSTHCIAFEITDYATNGKGVLLKAGVSRAGSPVMLDTTWWCADDSMASGWNTTAYTDTSKWLHPDVNTAYDNAGGAGSFIYPGNFWFRKKFTATQATAVFKELQKAMAGDRIAAVRYYNLQGRAVTVAGNRAASSNLLLKRVVYKNGTVRDARMVKTR